MKFGTNSGIFLLFSAFFGHFLWESRDISSFSENIREILIKFHQNFAEKWPNSLTKVGMKWNFISFHFIPAKKFDGLLLEFWGVSGAKAKKSCRARKMLKNEATLAIVAVDTGENEPLKVWGVSFHYFNRILNQNMSPRSILLTADQRLLQEPGFCFSLFPPLLLQLSKLATCSLRGPLRTCAFP